MNTNNTKLQRRNSGLLILTAFIWGIAFVAQSTGGDAVGPYTFNCIRFLVGSLFLVMILPILDRIRPEQEKQVTTNKKPLIIGGIACGLALCIASNLQQLGIYLGSSVGKAGFLTACYIILVPILGMFFKKKCGWNIWIGVLLTIVGLYLLCMEGSFTLQTSDILLLCCAFMFAIHILVIDHFSPLVDGVRMSCIQFFVAGVLSSIPMFLMETGRSMAELQLWLEPLGSLNSWFPILYAGIFSSGIAYTLQIIGQQGVNPTVASLLMSLESVFSVLAGWVLLNETMGLRQLSGCAIIFIAVILAQLPIAKSSN